MTLDNVELNVDLNEYVMDIVSDVFLFASANTNQERKDDVPPPMHKEAFEQYVKLLKSANQELYP